MHFNDYLPSLYLYCVTLTERGISPRAMTTKTTLGMSHPFLVFIFLLNRINIYSDIMIISDGRKDDVDSSISKEGYVFLLQCYLLNTIKYKCRSAVEWSDSDVGYRSVLYCLIIFM
jgi:hypothetical protein